MDDKFWLDLKIHLMGNFPIDILVYIVHMIEVRCKIGSLDHYSHSQQLDKFYSMKWIGNQLNKLNIVNCLNKPYIQFERKCYWYKFHLMLTEIQTCKWYKLN